MPIEIRELIIKAEVTGDRGDENRRRDRTDGSERERIIRDCVEQVREYFIEILPEILPEHKER